MSQQSLALSDDQLEAINTAIEQNMPEHIRYMLASLSAADIAHLLESSPPQQRSLIWKLVPTKKRVMSSMNWATKFASFLSTR